jgi:hypothetical protein
MTSGLDDRRDRNHRKIGDLRSRALSKRYVKGSLDDATQITCPALANVSSSKISNIAFPIRAMPTSKLITPNSPPVNQEKTCNPDQRQGRKAFTDTPRIWWRH